MHGFILYLRFFLATRFSFHSIGLNERGWMQMDDIFIWEAMIKCVLTLVHKEQRSERWANKSNDYISVYQNQLNFADRFQRDFFALSLLPIDFCIFARTSLTLVDNHYLFYAPFLHPSWRRTMSFDVWQYSQFLARFNGISVIFHRIQFFFHFWNSVCIALHCCLNVWLIRFGFE